MKTHSIDHFIRERESTRYFDAVPWICLSIISWLASLYSVVGVLCGESVWWLFVALPGLLIFVHRVLIWTHEINWLDRKGVDLYLLYRQLSKDSRLSMPRLTAESIGHLTSTQTTEVMRRIRELIYEEHRLAEAEKALDPTAKHILDALDERHNTLRDRVEIAQQIKKEML